MRRIPSRIRIISKHNVKAQRTEQITLLERQRGVPRTQRSTDGHLADAGRDSTRRTVDNVAVAWLYDWRRVRWARTWTRLVVVCGNASLCTSIDVITGERKMARALEDEESGCLNERGEVENEVADLALGSVGIELKVEDRAFVFRGYSCPFCGRICFVGVLCRYRDEG